MTLNIIHLPHRTDRLVNLHMELLTQNITDFQIWEGIIHSQKVQTGISMAHKQIVQFAFENKLPEILIGEDDLKFTAPGAFDHFLNNKPIDYDLYLGGISHGKLTEDKSVTDFAGLFFYMVHERFYQTFLSIDENMHLDRSLRNKGKYMVCDPQPVIEYGGYSDNLKQYYDSSVFYRNKNLFGH